MKKMFAIILCICLLTQVSFASFIEKVSTPLPKDNSETILKKEAVILCLELMNYDVSTYSDSELMMFANGLGMIDNVDTVGEYLIGTHFLKILIVALGYKEYANAQGGYPAGYFMAAQRAGIRTDRFVDDIIEKQDVYQILYQALEARMLFAESYSDDRGNIYQTTTPLEHYLKLHKVSGVMTSNSVSGLADSKKGVAIDDILYDGNDKYDEYLGQYVTAYLDEEDNIQFLMPDERKNDILHIDGSDIVGGTKETIEYEEDGKVLTADIALSAPCIVNGRFFAKMFTAYVSIDMLSSQNAEVTLIDNDNDGVYDVVSLCEYAVYVVERVNYTDRIIYSRIGAPAITLQSNNNVTIYKDGVSIEIDMIEAGDVLCVYAQQDTTNIKWGDVYVVNQSVQGDVTAIDTDYNVTIGDEIYELGSTLVEIENQIEPEVFHPYQHERVRIGDSGTFMLDIKGKIAAKVVQKNEEIAYAYLVATGKDSGVANKYKIKCFMQNGTFSDLELADKLNVTLPNETKVLEASKVYSQYLSNDNATVNQLIKFKMQNDKVKDIYISTGDILANTFSKVDLFDTLNLNDKGTYYCNELFKNKYFLPNNTPVFVIPSDLKDERSYRIDNVKMFIGTHYYRVSLYEPDDYSTMGAAVFYETKPTLAYANRLLVIDKISKILNDNGEERIKVSGYYTNKYESYSTFSEDIINDHYDAQASRNWGYEGLRLSELKKGDVIMPVFNKAGEINNFRIFYLYAPDTENFNSTNSGANVANTGYVPDVALTIAFGDVIKNNGQIMQFNIGGPKLMKFDKSRYEVYCYDTAKNKLLPAAPSDIAVGDKMFIRFYYSYLQTVVIYK